MALSTCPIKDYLYQWCLQFLVQTYGVNVSIKRSAANALCELLPRFIKEMGRISERLAREEGRVAVNASDVLCSYGDVDGLMAFWSASSAQTFEMNVCNLSRKRCAKLRPTISEVQESHPEYIPSFLPLLPKHSSLITDGRFQRTENRDNESSSKRHKARHFCEPGGPFFSQNALRLANSRESTVLSRSVCETLAQPLRNPVKEEKLVTRAKTLNYEVEFSKAFEETPIVFVVRSRVEASKGFPLVSGHKFLATFSCCNGKPKRDTNLQRIAGSGIPDLVGEEATVCFCQSSERRATSSSTCSVEVTDALRAWRGIVSLRACGAIGTMAVVGQRLCTVTGPVQLRKTSGNRRRPIIRYSERCVEGNSDNFKYIQATPITEWDFAPFGQIVRWQEDGKPYDSKDLNLDLSAGEPRLYIFRKREAGLHFSTITYHSQVTQCLKAANDQAWYLAVSAPTFSLEESPTLETIRAFRIEVKLNVGVWHAGPLFEGTEFADFINLELSDTNINDHMSYSFSECAGFDVYVLK